LPPVLALTPLILFLSVICVKQVLKCTAHLTPEKEAKEHVIVKRMDFNICNETKQR